MNYFSEDLAEFLGLLAKVTLGNCIRNENSTKVISKKSSITPQNFLITFVFLEIQCPQSPPGLLFFWNIPIFDDIMVVATVVPKNKFVCKKRRFHKMVWSPNMGSRVHIRGQENIFFREILCALFYYDHCSEISSMSCSPT